jgi:hypothetical protein
MIRSPSDHDGDSPPSTVEKRAWFSSEIQSVHHGPRNDGGSALPRDALMFRAFDVTGLLPLV